LSCSRLATEGNEALAILRAQLRTRAGNERDERDHDGRVEFLASVRE
jgi:hypothetical protein